MSLDLDFGAAAVERAGYSLVHFRAAAAPMYQLTVRVLTLDRKPLNPIEEGCLRAVDAGLESSSDVREFLGLQDMVLNVVLASLYSQELINYQCSSSAVAKVALTSKGKQALQDLRLVMPQERVVKLVFNPILRQVEVLQQGALWRPREVRATGRFEIPLCGVRRPEVRDIPLEDIDRALERVRRTSEESTELLAIRRIERRELLFMPCTLLYFRENAGTDVQVAFHFEQGLSLAYENAFRELGGPDEVGAAHLSVSSQDPVATFTQAQDHVEVPEPPPPGDSASARIALSVPTLKVIRCHDHPPLLARALASSNERLLIVSPWIRSQIVDKVFLKALETLLRNGVRVHIGYGIDEERKGSKPIIDKAAKDGLEDLQRRYKNFQLALIGNTHRKTLVCDRKFAVQTSFNWLSFRGDPNMHPRDESGLLVSKLEYIDQMFKDNLDLINQGYDHPKSPPG